MRKRNKKLKFLFMIIAIIFVFIFQTIAYSSIFSTMTITGDAYARVKADVRVTDFKISEVSSDSVSYYEKFGKDHLLTNVNLPSSNSYIIYKVEITNFGSRDAGIYSINLNNSNLKYELIDYTVGNKIYDSSNGKYTLGAKQTFYIKILYNNYDSSNTNFDVKVNFDFQPFYNVTYKNFKRSYTKEVLGKSTFEVDLSYDKPSKIVVYVNNNISSNYIFSNNVLTINNVSGDITIEKKQVYEEDELLTSVPILDEKMVPVTWDYDQETWVVADIYEEWYCYGDSNWANVIIVDDNVNYAPGTTIDVYDSSILQWYVWIPEFYLYVYGDEPGDIDLYFGVADVNYSHSAFVTNDIVVPGFWVGKFSNSGFNILPNMSAGIAAITQASTVGLMTYESDLYKSAMIKNSQWAAIAYLSSSYYGKLAFDNEEVYLISHFEEPYNSTGLSLYEHPNNYNYETYKFSENADDKFYASSSTTGNVYGVYDMVNHTGTLVAAAIQGQHNIINGDCDIYMPTDLGYWDEEHCYKKECKDHAMYESAGWFDDYYFDKYGISSEFNVKTNPFLLRGTYREDYCDVADGCAGIFSVFGVSHEIEANIRVVLNVL